MKTHIRDIFYFSLVSFYFLSVDIVMNKEAARIFDEKGILAMNVAYLLIMCSGFVTYSFLGKLQGRIGRKIMFFVGLMSIASLFAFILVEQPAAFILLAMSNMFTAGMIGGNGYWQMALQLRDRICTGRVGGGCPSVVQHSSKSYLR